MFQYQKLPENVVKYLIIFGIIFCLIIVIPNNKLGVKDTIILAIIIALSIAIIEHTTLLLSNKNTQDPEKFDSIQQVQEQPVISRNDATQQLDKNKSEQPVPPQISDKLNNSQQLQNVNVQQDAKLQSDDTRDVKIQPEQTIVVTNTPNTDVKTINLYNGAPNSDKKMSNGSRSENDVITSDMPYTDYHHLPLADDYKPSDFEYGYSFLPPEKWYPTPPFPPVCVSEKRCPVCPVYTTGTPVDVKEWNSASKIMPPDGFNIDFIKKLNAGR